MQWIIQYSYSIDEAFEHIQLHCIISEYTYIYIYILYRQFSINRTLRGTGKYPTYPDVRLIRNL